MTASLTGGGLTRNELTTSTPRIGGDSRPAICNGARLSSVGTQCNLTRTATLRFDAMNHNTDHTFTATNTDGFNTVTITRSAIRTMELRITVTASNPETSFRLSNGTYQAGTRSGCMTATNSTAAAPRELPHGAQGGWSTISNRTIGDVTVGADNCTNSLTHGQTHTARAYLTDGHNTVFHTATMSTVRVNAPARPAAPTCNAGPEAWNTRSMTISSDVGSTPVTCPTNSADFQRPANPDNCDGHPGNCTGGQASETTRCYGTCHSLPGTVHASAGTACDRCDPSVNCSHAPSGDTGAYYRETEPLCWA